MIPNLNFRVRKQKGYQLNIQIWTVTKSKKEITNTIYAELSINQYETMHETQIHTRELLGPN